MRASNFELKNRAFYGKTLHIMIPVVLQQLITVGINFLDNLMVGGFGETQIAAAAFGNQFYSLFQFICMGLGSGAVVMSAQFWGRRETGAMRTVTAIALRMTFLLCAAFTVAAAGFPHIIQRIFTDDPDIVIAGTPYMRLIGTTFLLCGLSSTATYLMRSVGRVNIALIGSAIAFFLNLFFNWVFIFGKFGAPRLEIVGAAVGTVIARAFEFCFVFGYFILKEKSFGFRLKHVFLTDAQLRRQYMRYSLPVLISDTLLGVSLALFSVIYGHIGGEISAANSIINSFAQLITVLNTGMAGAAAVVIGNSIGEDDIPRARREANTYVLVSFLFGVAIIPLLLLLERPYVSMYSITETTLAMTHDMMICICAMMPLQTVAYITSKGILRGGGDSRFLLLADSSLCWFVSLPLGVLAAFVWHLPALWIFVFMRLEYPLKGVVCLIRFLTGKWIKEIKASDGGA